MPLVIKLTLKLGFSSQRWALSKVIKRGENTPYMKAIKENKVYQLRQHLDQDDDDLAMGLTSAALFGYLEIVTLLANSTDINCVNPALSVTPLGMATLGNRLEVAKFLLNHGASPNQTAFGYTPLFKAATFNLVDMVKLLLEHDAKLDKSSKGDTALNTTILFGNDSIVDLLLEHNANVNKHVNIFKFAFRETTPLISAIINNDSTIVEKLLKHGANVNLKDAAGNLPITYAKTVQQNKIFKSNKIINLLLEYGANNADIDQRAIPELTSAIKNLKKTVNTNAMLIKYGVNIENKDSDDNDSYSSSDFDNDTPLLQEDNGIHSEIIGYDDHNQAQL